MKSAKIAFIFLFMLLISRTSYAQKKNPWVMMLELGGNSVLASMNVEHAHIQKDKYQVNSRLGTFLFPLKNPDFITVIGGGNIILNLKKSHHLEGGCALSYIRGLKSTESGGVKGTDEAIYFAPAFGYRYDDLKTGLVFRFAWTPLFPVYDFWSTERVQKKFGSHGDDFLLAEKWVKHVGISMGYRF